MSEARTPILKIRDLSVSFKTQAGMVNAVRGVNFDLYKGETVAIVGESGCGKSVTVKAIMGILSSNQVINSGSIEYTFFDKDTGKERTVDLVKMNRRELQTRIKGRQIAMVFQDPMTSLNPTMTIGKQIMEGPMLHHKLSKQEAWKRAVELLEQVGIEEPEKRMKQYPHQLSGGMRQRVVIAIALSCRPDLLICDEPTTALDVTIQARILQLLIDIQKKTGISIIFITHDLGVVAKVADYVNVMYAGKIVETGTVDDIFYDPRHPYTWGLLASMPDVNTNDKRLTTIPGNPPNLLYPIVGDAFAPRNKYALNIDFEEEPPMFTINKHHQAATWLLHPNAPETPMPPELKKKIDLLMKEVQ
jgi:oligopeptide transport system ATP-binding protein